jgi:hypothetical protein
MMQIPSVNTAGVQTCGCHILGQSLSDMQTRVCVVFCSPVTEHADGVNLACGHLLVSLTAYMLYGGAPGFPEGLYPTFGWYGGRCM